MNVRYLLLTPLLVAAVGCGGGSGSTSSTDNAAAERSASAKASAASASAEASESAAEQAALAAKQQARHDACQTGASGLISAMGEIDSRLDVGLTYADYSSRVGDAKVAYDAMVKAGAQRQCLLKVEAVLETGLNEYLDVYTQWGDCINDYSCDFSEGDANDKAQKGWANAGRDLAKAQRGLDSLAPAT